MEWRSLHRVAHFIGEAKGIVLINKKKKIFRYIDQGDLESIKMILAKRPQLIEAIGDNDAYCLHKTPLMYSIQCLQTDIASWLIDAGANVDFQMLAGLKTPALSLCADPYFPVELFAKMLALGANANRYDHVGHTVAYVVVGNCSTSMENHGLEKIKLLAKHGADFDFAPTPDDPDIDPMSAREYAQSLDDLPYDVADFLGLQKNGSKRSLEPETDNVIFEYPDSELDDYRAALEHGFGLPSVNESREWIYVGVQGGTESAIKEDVFAIKGRRFLFSFDQIHQRRRNKSYIAWFSNIEKDEDGFCLLPADVSAEQLAELVDFICTRITRLPKFQGDYAVGFEYWPDFDYEAFKNSVV